MKDRIFTLANRTVCMGTSLPNKGCSGESRTVAGTSTAYGDAYPSAVGVATLSADSHPDQSGGMA